MSKTTWQDPGTNEIRSPHIAGLQSMVGKIEDVLDLVSVSVTGIALSEVYDPTDATTRYRIYQSSDYRNWISGSVTIYSGGSPISDGFEYDYGGGAIVFSSTVASGSVFTADVNYVLASSNNIWHTGNLAFGTGSTNMASGNHDHLQYLNTTGGIFSGDVDFTGYKAIAMACDNGTSFPENPTMGQWFYHSGATVNCLFMYIGTTWKPIITFGTLTLYVNATSGSDAAGKGYARGSDACATVTYAMGLIPANFGGNVIINITGETYAEDLIVKGKYPTGSYNIYIYGTEGTPVETGTVSSSTIADADTYYLDDSSKSWGTDDYLGYLVEMTSGVAVNEKLVIESNTGTRLRVVAKWTGTPASGDTYAIHKPATKIQSITNYVGACNVYVYDVDFIHTSGRPIVNQARANLYLYYCRATGNATSEIILNNGLFTAAYSYFCGPGNTRVFLNNDVGASAGLNYSFLKSLAASGASPVILSTYISKLSCGYGTAIKGAKGNGIELAANSHFSTWTGGVGGRIRIMDNGGYGIYSSLGSMAQNCTVPYYLNNTGGTYYGDTATLGYAG